MLHIFYNSVFCLKTYLYENIFLPVNKNLVLTPGCWFLNTGYYFLIKAKS